jgi:hypothetical protein
LDYAKNKLILNSNLSLSNYPGLSLSFFQGCAVIIDNTYQSNLQYQLDENGCLVIYFLPDLVYDG